jgi:hypothetical protein
MTASRPSRLATSGAHLRDEASQAWSTHWPTSFWATTVRTIRRGLTGSLPESCRASPEVCEPSDNCPAGHFRTYLGEECQHHELRSGRSLPDFWGIAKSPAAPDGRAGRSSHTGLASASRDWPTNLGGTPKRYVLHQARVRSANLDHLVISSSMEQENTTQDDKRSHSGFVKRVSGRHDPKQPEFQSRHTGRKDPKGKVNSSLMTPHHGLAKRSAGYCGTLQTALVVEG